MPTSRAAPRRLTPLLGGVLAAVTVAAVPAQATPAPTAAPTVAPGTTPRAAPSAALGGTETASQRLTLPTGDQVQVSFSGGRASVVVDVAVRGDGSRPAVVTYTRPGGADTYAVPEDALPYVRSGALDEDLFNVTYLTRNGYGDADSTSLPLLVRFGDQPQAQATAAARTLPGAVVRRGLPALHGAAVSVPKTQAGKFWASLQDPSVPPGEAADAASPRPSHGVTKVWLDHRMHVTLDESVPLVGAPQAWQAGYDGTGVKVAVLDSGVDPTHPDLAGRIAAMQNFTDGPDAVDRHGHGTHVASTIAGSGAASSGKYKGMAPGTSLLVGKVCDDEGGCFESSILAGMQWAADQGARVVSMSLGGSAGTGVDPLTQAVNDLTGATGTLFVIAAGNEGQAGDSTVSSPGVAEAALTVAATDKSDQLASFSSRGPLRSADGRLMKPDIAAPGVKITAARADGTALGPVVDEKYTTISGTSMATPHVSGAAAILAQQHPDWTAPQLKAALTGSATDVGYTAFEQGAGRLDVARAVTQQVRASTPNLDFGRLEYPHDQPVARTITYLNDGDTPVTLSLHPTLGMVGGDASDGALTADTTVTVPAHGRADAAVTLDPADLAAGTYSGAVVATAEGIRIRTPVGARPGPKLVDVAVHVLGRAGLPCGEGGDTVSIRSNCWVVSNFGFMNLDDPQYSGVLISDPSVLRLPVGHYSFVATVEWYDTATSTGARAQLAAPEVEVADDTSVTLDARTARQLVVSTPRPAEAHATTLATWRSDRTGMFSLGVGVVLPYAGAGSVWTNQAEQVQIGDFLFVHRITAGAPLVEMEMSGPKRFTFRPWYAFEYGTDLIPHFSGTRTFPLVDVGTGISGDVGDLVRGRLVLVDVDAERTFRCYPRQEQLDALVAAGAAGVIAYDPQHLCDKGSLAGGSLAPRVPLVGISVAEADTLRTALRKRTVELTVRGTEVTPYMYHLKFYHQGRVADTHEAVTDDQMSRTRATYHAEKRVLVYGLSASWKGIEMADAANAVVADAPVARDEFTGPIYDGEDFLLLGSEIDFDRPRAEFKHAKLSPGNRPDEHWLAPLSVPGAAPPSEVERVVTLCAACRQGDLFYPVLPLTYTDPAVFSSQPPVALFADSDVHLYRDGEEVPMTPQAGIVTAFTLPAGDAVYRLTANWTDVVPEAFGTRVESEWTFHSAQPDADGYLDGITCLGSALGSTQPCAPQPLVYLRYDLGLDPDNRTGRSTHTIHVTAYHEGSTQAMPAIRSLAVSASFDGGRTWTPTRVSGTSGDYTVTVPQAPMGAGDTVTLRATAVDAAGNSITQTSYHAYGLRSS